METTTSAGTAVLNAKFTNLMHLKLSGDNAAYLVGATEYFRGSVERLLRKQGVDPTHFASFREAFEANVGLMPPDIVVREDELLTLFRRLEGMAGPMNWYQGEHVDYSQVLHEQEDNLNLALNLFQPKR